MREKSAILIPFCEIKKQSGQLNTSLHNVTLIINQTFVVQSMIFIFFTIYYLKEQANKLYGETYYMLKYGN
jgi:hypothetical protein